MHSRETKLCGSTGRPLWLAASLYTLVIMIMMMIMIVMMILIMMMSMIVMTIMIMMMSMIEDCSNNDHDYHHIDDYSIGDDHDCEAEGGPCGLVMIIIVLVTMMIMGMMGMVLRMMMGMVGMVLRMMMGTWLISHEGQVGGRDPNTRWRASLVDILVGQLQVVGG